MAEFQRLAVGFLFDDTLDSNDGVSQYVKTLGGWLSDNGHRVSYIVGETKLGSWQEGKIYSLSRNLPVNFNGNKLSIPLPTDKNKIKQLLKSENFDVLHVQVPHSPFMSGRVIHAAPQSTAVVGTFHILPAGRLAKLGSSALRLMYLNRLHRFDDVMSVSLPAAKFASEYFGLHSSVVPNVINLAKFASGRDGKKIMQSDILFLGRLVKRKGCMELLKAFAILHKRNPRLKLSIAGSGPEKSELEKYVIQNKLSSAVTFLGYIEEADKPALLASTKIACFPALYGESFGIVLLEAMASGAGVVVGGNNPGYKSVLGEQPELLINPGDATAFSRKLDLLLNDSRLRRKLHSWQENHVKQYDVSVVGPVIVNHYQQAIASRKVMVLR